MRFLATILRQNGLTTDPLSWLLLASMFVGPWLGAPAADPPAAPVIRLPELVAPPAPMPGPDAVAKLDPSTLYVVDSDDPSVLVLASPKGLVSIVREEGPVKVRGRFADGTGKIETRTYRGKAVFFIEPAHTGRVELLIVPTGAKSDADVIRRTIDVDAGEGPIPPPVVDQFVKELKDAYGTEPAADKRASLTGLRGVYVAGVKASATAATWGDLFTAMSAEAMQNGAAGKLTGLQKIIAAELKKTLPSDGAGMTAMAAADRTKAAAAFNRIIVALDEVTK